MNIALWIIQVLLALVFIFSGGMKLVISPEVLQSMGSPNQIRLPGLLIQFVGVCEVLGALGLILPGLLRIKTGLTPLAAAGLVILMNRSSRADDRGSRCRRFDSAAGGGPAGRVRSLRSLAPGAAAR
jgi:uncharacterized membrane protein